MADFIAIGESGASVRSKLNGMNDRLSDLGGAVFDPSAFLKAYPTARWWSPRALAQAHGSAISQVYDRSLNASHLVMPTGANQPTFTVTDGVGRAVFDSGDYLQLAGSAALDLGSVTKLTCIAALRHTVSAVAVVCEGGAPISTSGGWGLYINNGSAGAVGAGVGDGAAGVNNSYNFRDSSGFGVVPRSYVVAATIDTTRSIGEQVTLWVDAIKQPTISAAAPKSTVSGNIDSALAFTVGRRIGGTLPFTSHLFDLVVVPGGVTDADIAAMSRHLFNECEF